MSKKFLRTMALVLVFATLMTTAAFADGQQTREFSYYINGYRAFISSPSSGLAQINFEIDAMEVSDKVGATSICLQCSTDDENWQNLYYFYPTNYSNMMKTNVLYNYSNVQLNVASGYYYRAGVTFYVENDGGSDSRFYVTGSKYI